jgi:hypothetical protein
MGTQAVVKARAKKCSWVNIRKLNKYYLQYIYIYMLKVV